MSKDSEKSRIKPLLGPLYCAVGGVFVMAALGFALQVSAVELYGPLRFLNWSALYLTAPVGFFFLGLGLHHILKD